MKNTDKTFGLKNKNKSQKVKKLIELEEKQKNSKQNAKEQQKQIKKQNEVKEQEIQALFSTIQITQKVPFGVDPKTVFCLNFKNKNCTKGLRCKFSHDPNVGVTVCKVSIVYSRWWNLVQRYR
jgi:hypothetical protein